MAAFLPLKTIRTFGERCWLYTFIVILALCGCSDPLARENEALRSQITEVHDEAMAKIGYMFELETRLKNLQPGPKLPADRLQRSVFALQQANRDMFSWMNQYQTLFMADDLSLDNEYRRQQLEKIEAVSRLTDSAITDAEQILEAD
ncbi:MAG: hypothetical protein KJN87_01500 [Desulfofustis sp.]|nr:hypothetical protein [Desulfofustis sp.]MBT8345760.1 hypothetical protein [Desulfofustis sp.]NNF46254.1 hypothetical protein [Desulfofustis sp.]NNK58576.1 hypothetical protein [Desulfofustis sp.]RZW26607.1 MAG: hypothetical protein EX260_01075 [Desulfobulbaceae bacterium]